MVVGRGAIIELTMDDATLAIAIWGAVTGTIATSGGIVALLRDSPKLEASQQLHVMRAGDRSTAKLVLHVVNNGRQPVTVFEAGFSSQWKTEGRWLRRRRRVPISRNLEANTPDLPARLGPGEPLTITLDLIKPGYVYTPDKAPQGFAMDTRGKLTNARPQITDEHLQEVYDHLHPAQPVRGKLPS